MNWTEHSVYYMDCCVFIILILRVQTQNKPTDLQEEKESKRWHFSFAVVNGSAYTFPPEIWFRLSSVALLLIRKVI